MVLPHLRIRRAVLFGAPVLYFVLGVLHPADPDVGDSTGLFIGLHLVQPALICLLAWTLWLLVDGRQGRAATAARLLIVPYAVAYAVFDAVAGIAMGTVVHEANALPGDDHVVAQQLIDKVRDNPLGIPMYVGSSVLWLAAALAVVVALWRIAPRPAAILMAIGAVFFAVGHPRPPGPIGMALFLAGVVWLELRPVREESLVADPAVRSGLSL